MPAASSTAAVTNPTSTLPPGPIVLSSYDRKNATPRTSSTMPSLFSQSVPNISSMSIDDLNRSNMVGRSPWLQTSAPAMNRRCDGGAGLRSRSGGGGDGGRWRNRNPRSCALPRLQCARRRSRRGRGTLSRTAVVEEGFFPSFWEACRRRGGPSPDPVAPYLTLEDVDSAAKISPAELIFEPFAIAPSIHPPKQNPGTE